MTAYDLTRTPSLWFERMLSLDGDYVKRRIEDFLNEDMPEGDATTQATVAPDTQAQAELLANQSMVFAGEQVLIHCFSDQTAVQILAHDGDAVGPGTVLARLRGPARELLARERVVLNLLQRLCGIATLTREYTDLPAPEGFRLLDTRKTTPGLRLFEKYAVAVGGGHNHRLDLSAVIMIKDNHLVAAGGIALALAKVRAENIRELFVELEVDTLEQLDQALDLGGFDAFLLDNMPPETIRRAVERVRQHPKGGMRIFLEASGGITRETLPEYIWTGVNGISVGALTTQARNVDIKLEFVAG
ncbi:MAG TPA: carboxylating nicotinate-nucleotide diphosphorylase [Candidatus Obscuribacterales bacterium]